MNTSYAPRMDLPRPLASAPVSCSVAADDAHGPEHDQLRSPQFSPARGVRATVFGLILTGLLLPSTATADELAANTPEGLEFFEKQVRPVLVEHCYDCHSGEENNGGLLVDSRQALLSGGDSGPAVVPGDADHSLLIEAVRYHNRELQMPPDNRLPAAELAVLEQWVNRGLPDPRLAASSGPAPVGMSIEEGRQFWSFRPVEDVPVPQPSDNSWVQTPIDAFVLARLEQAELKPAPQADKRSLIRRVTLNLTGLPPTVEEINNFLADDSPQAWEKVVDRLLASPQYGVRWGRHWLDVARYADSNGLDENLAYGHSWRYRDYVIDAFNSDKPFDRFVVEQLAGDLLPGASQETRSATGFLSLGAKVLAEPDMDKLVMDTIDEQLDTTGKAFLGMTLGCVRCHDHKFDPLKQTDYYSLAAIFKSTRTFAETRTGIIKHWYEHSFATDEEKEQLKPIDDKIKKARSAAGSFKSKAIGKLRTAAQAHAADYLAAATMVSADASLEDYEQAAAAQGLHPRILHHCRQHLKFHRYDPLFEPWHRLRPQGADAVAAHYRSLFDQVDQAWQAAQAKTPKATTLEDPLLEQARLARADASGFLAVPPKVEFAFDAETLKEYNRLEEIARVLESQAPDAAAAMGVSEQETLTELAIHIRGSHLNLGDKVPRAFPQVMTGTASQPPLPDKQSGRLELARWMVHPDHPLTARVFVNRVWNWHFGRGIVASTENFGQLGSRPSHPQLLDWLARRFVESGWKVKELHRLILLSSTWQMAATHPQQELAEQADPENNLLWKFRLQRLDAEQIRDSILAVSGQLETQLGGKTVPLRNRQFVFNHTSVDHTKYDSLRRAVYLPVIRNNLYTMFEQFDFPDPTMPTGRRNETVIAPQALLLLNSGLVVDAARTTAQKLLQLDVSDAQRVSQAYEMTLGRTATPAETDRALSFIASVTETPAAVGINDHQQLQVWGLFCQSLFAGNEFMYVR